MSDADRTARREALFGEARSGSRQAFAEWAALVEPDIREGLARSVRSADLEARARETFHFLEQASRDGSPRAREGDSLALARSVAADVALDDLFRRAATDEAAFTAWVRAVEIPLRARLRREASVVDVEVVLQETLLRMWVIARKGRSLEGCGASLRLAYGVLRNVLYEEYRKMRRHGGPPVDQWPEDSAIDIPAPPRDPPDPLLRRRILECLESLKEQAKIPWKALTARLQFAHLLPDRDLAADLGMKKNTFLQNIVRARKFLGGCLESKGVRLEEVWR